MQPLETVFVICAVIGFILLSISLVVIAFTTGFKKTGRLSGGLYCITAPPGNGKSYVATHLAVDFMKQGRKVFTNYPIAYNDGRLKLTSLALTKDMLLGKNLSGSILVIDEAHQWFWSRKFKEFNEEYKNWFSSLAQHEISCYYIVQHEDRIDTIINDCANLFCVIEKIEIPFLDMPLVFNLTWWNRELDLQMSRTNPTIEPFHEERIWFDRDIAQSYDTKFFAFDKRLQYEGIDWITYLASKNIEYRGNYNFSLKSQIINVILAKLINPIKVKLEPMTKRVERIWQQIGNRFDRDRDDETIVSPLAGTEGAIQSQVTHQQITDEEEDEEEELNKEAYESDKSGDWD